MTNQHDVNGEDVEQRCPVADCSNPAQPPEKWGSCFYDGSPCQRERTVVFGSSGASRPEGGEG
jgi:hypothetical protein